MVRHTSKNGKADYKLTINGEICNIQLHNRDVKGKVHWIGDCSLKLEPELHLNQDTTELERELYQSFGESFIEIKATKGDTTFFRTTWTGNLHITINEGYFIRIK